VGLRQEPERGDREHVAEHAERDGAAEPDDRREEADDAREQRAEGAADVVVAPHVEDQQRREDAEHHQDPPALLVAHQREHDRVQAIAACESGGNPSTDTGNGFYGKYQFTQETWQSVGGSGNPAHASEAEQDRRAAQLYAQSGPSPWPVCGR
jgi:hypothetical protein